MKRIIFVLVLGLFLGACNPNHYSSEEKTDSTTNLRPVDSANAGLTGTTNANGFIPADSNKSIKAPMDSSANGKQPNPPKSPDSSK